MQDTNKDNSPPPMTLDQRIEMAEASLGAIELRASYKDSSVTDNQLRIAEITLLGLKKEKPGLSEAEKEILEGKIEVLKDLMKS